LLLGQFAGVGNLALDDVFRHGALLRLRFWLLQPRTRILTLLEVPHTPQTFYRKALTFVGVESESRELPHLTIARYPSCHA
jgi:hypothetical protein